MYAIIEFQGHQHKVAIGERLTVDRWAGEIGDTVLIDRVLAVMDGEKTKVGQPLLSKATVGLKLLRHVRGPKINVLKYKNKLNYHITKGHRQDLTELEVTDINA